MGHDYLKLPTPQYDDKTRYAELPQYSALLDELASAPKDLLELRDVVEDNVELESSLLDERQVMVEAITGYITSGKEKLLESLPKSLRIVLTKNRKSWSESKDVSVEGTWQVVWDRYLAGALPATVKTIELLEELVKAELVVETGPQEVTFEHEGSTFVFLVPSYGRFKDFTDAFQPKLIKTIEDKELWANFIDNDNFAPIFAILRSGPKTIKDIARIYRTRKGEEKSENTIYRYIKTLMKENFVVEAGQRVVNGRTATEKLYARTHQIFYFFHSEVDEMTEQEKSRLAVALGAILGNHLPSSSVDEEKLQAVLMSLQKRLEDLTHQLIKSDAGPEVVSKVQRLPIHQTKQLLNTAGLLVWLLQDDEVMGLVSELRDALGVGKGTS